ncbi:hypothetical protein ACFX12_000986 [Malus domestica]
MGGEDVRVWVDRWLPSLPSGHPMPLGKVEVTKNLRVSSLIDSSSRQWDFEFLRPFLSMADQRAIQETLIGDSRRNDWLVWAANRNGKYSVKSGYRWLQIQSLEVRDHRLPGAVLSSNRGSSVDRKWFQAYVAFTCWFIWKARCDYLFNQVSINPSKVIFSLSTAFGNYLHAVSNLGVARPVSGSREDARVRWCPPSSPFVKINVDASWSKYSRLGFVGVVARQEGGLFQAAVRSSLSAPSSLVAESIAILRGCELGASLGFSYVIIESDSLQAISCLNGSIENGNWEAFPILAQAQRLGSAFQNCRWS